MNVRGVTPAAQSVEAALYTLTLASAASENSSPVFARSSSCELLRTAALGRSFVIGREPLTKQKRRRQELKVCRAACPSE